MSEITTVLTAHDLGSERRVATLQHR